MKGSSFIIYVDYMCIIFVLLLVLFTAKHKSIFL